MVMDEAVIHSEPSSATISPCACLPPGLLVEHFESQVLGSRVTIPGPDDEMKSTFAKALLRLRNSTNPSSGPVHHVGSLQVTRALVVLQHHHQLEC